MQIKFDGNQQYQLDAIAAVTDVFDGTPLAAGTFSATLTAAPGELLTDEGIANFLPLTADAIIANVAAVQGRNGLVGEAPALTPLPPLPPKGEGEPKALVGRADAPIPVTGSPSPFGGRGGRGVRAGASPTSLNPDGSLQFSLEMETGTGKTYVYLRTLFELNAKYGWKKFVIVVPSVAIREGVLQTLRQTEAHFRALYDAVPVTTGVYDSKQATRLREFAVSNQMQILVMNIQAFNAEDRIMRRELDRLTGRRPLDFIQAARPIVILDEPQNMESDNAKKAIADLNPLCVLRYSATHKDPVNLLYRLDPAKAYDLGLVKRIEVTSVTDGNPDFNRPHLRVLTISATARQVSAKIEFDVAGASGPVRTNRVFAFKTGQELYDLYELSGERDIYRGYVIEDIRADSRKVLFSNGEEVHEGAAHGDDAEAKMRVMVAETVRAHLDKERDIARRPAAERMKVLSLFFIDRVANYADEDGKIRRAFHDAYAAASAEPKYAALNLPPVGDVHNGYFATNKGRPIDASGTTQADALAYELIMKDKERLLSLNEPLRFIFSHSALSEGWDNPNVFQICTLNDLQSVTRKRQRIGRGLRLPVMQSGDRCHEAAVNKLTVIANESFKDFARQLQKEIQDETGADFSNRIANSRDRHTAILRKDWRHNEYFLGLWEKIKHKTRYAVEYDTEILIANAAGEFAKSQPIVPPRFHIETMNVEITGKGVAGTRAGRVREQSARYGANRLPDLLGYLQAKTELTRPTLAAILRRSGRLPEVFVNPQQFLDQSVTAICTARDALLISGVKYEKWAGHVYEMSLFETQEIERYRDRMAVVKNGLYDTLEYDSAPEKAFAEFLDNLPEVKLFIKLPDWFKIETPLGTYNPDWAIVVEEAENKKDRLYLVRETKGTANVNELDRTERDKIHCGRRHFDALNVDFRVANGNAKTLDLADEY